MNRNDSLLQRPPQPMPDDIAQLLERRSLRDAYDQRPAYQRNDYLAWIGRAKLAATRQKRIAQMLDELADGGVYMGMAHRPSTTCSSALPLTQDNPWNPPLPKALLTSN